MCCHFCLEPTYPALFALFILFLFLNFKSLLQCFLFLFPFLSLPWVSFLITANLPLLCCRFFFSFPFPQPTWLILPKRSNTPAVLQKNAQPLLSPLSLYINFTWSRAKGRLLDMITSWTPVILTHVAKNIFEYGSWKQSSVYLWASVTGCV